MRRVRFNKASFDPERLDDFIDSLTDLINDIYDRSRSTWEGEDYYLRLEGQISVAEEFEELMNFYMRKISGTGIR